MFAIFVLNDPKSNLNFFKLNAGIPYSFQEDPLLANNKRKKYLPIDKLKLVFFFYFCFQDQCISTPMNVSETDLKNKACKNAHKKYKCTKLKNV